MAEYDEQSRRLTLKLVYYGPALSGKTTNLMALHDGLRAELLGDLMTLETQGDRTLFFDLLPLGFRAPSGLLIKFKLFTVPGQVAHDSTRKAVLSRADGVVFVADSQRGQSLNNTESFQNLADNVARIGLDFDQLPLVVQFNKRDLTDVLSEQDVLDRWRSTPWPVKFATALQGRGVLDTFSSLLERVYAVIDPLYGLARDHGLSGGDFVVATMGSPMPLAR